MCVCVYIYIYVESHSLISFFIDDFQPLMIGPILDNMVVSRYLLGDLVRRTAYYAYRFISSSAVVNNYEPPYALLFFIWKLKQIQNSILLIFFFFDVLMAVMQFVNDKLNKLHKNLRRNWLWKNFIIWFLLKKSRTFFSNSLPSRVLTSTSCLIWFQYFTHSFITKNSSKEYHSGNSWNTWQ